MYYCNLVNDKKLELWDAHKFSRGGGLMKRDFKGSVIN